MKIHEEKQEKIRKEKERERQQQEANKRLKFGSNRHDYDHYRGDYRGCRYDGYDYDDDKRDIDDYDHDPYSILGGNDGDGPMTRGRRRQIAEKKLLNTKTRPKWMKTNAKIKCPAGLSNMGNTCFMVCSYCLIYFKYVLICI